MPRITYIEFDGRSEELEVPVGRTIMEGAIENDVEGVIGECGGCCSCATCHVYIDPEWFEQVGFPSPIESDMLEMVDDLHSNSRLGCQIDITDELDGIIVRLPEFQI